MILNTHGYDAVGEDVLVREFLNKTFKTFPSTPRMLYPDAETAIETLKTSKLDAPLHPGVDVENVPVYDINGLVIGFRHYDSSNDGAYKIVNGDILADDVFWMKSPFIALSAARSLPPVTGKLPYSCYHIFDDTNVGIAFSGTWALQVNMSVYIYGDGTTTVRDMIVNGGVLSVYCNVASTFIDGLPSNNLVINFQKDFTCIIDKPELITMPQTSNDYFYQPVEMMNLVDSVGNIYSVRFSSDRRASRLMRITPSGDVTVISVPDTIYYLFNIADRVYMCCGSGLYAVDNMVVVELYLADWVYMGCPQDDGKILISYLTPYPAHKAITLFDPVLKTISPAITTIDDYVDGEFVNVTKNKSLWILCGNYLKIFKKGVLERTINLPSKCSGVMWGGANSVYAVCNDFLFEYNISTYELTYLPIYIGHFNLRCTCIDNNDILYICAYATVYRYDKTNKTYIIITGINAALNFIAMLPNGTLFVQPQDGDRKVYSYSGGTSVAPVSGIVFDNYCVGVMAVGNDLYIPGHIWVKMVEFSSGLLLQGTGFVNYYNKSVMLRDGGITGDFALPAKRLELYNMYPEYKSKISFNLPDLKFYGSGELDTLKMDSFSEIYFDGFIANVDLTVTSDIISVKIVNTDTLRITLQQKSTAFYLAGNHKNVTIDANNAYCDIVVTSANALSLLRAGNAVVISTLIVNAPTASVSFSDVKKLTLRNCEMNVTALLLMNAPLSLHSCYITTKTAITINGGGLVVNGTTIVSGGASCLISNAAMLATIISLFSNKPVDGSITNVIKNPVLVIDAGVSSVCGDATAADIRRFK